PRQWNALKLLDNNGEFLSEAQGKEVLEIAAGQEIEYAKIENIGTIKTREDYIDLHIKRILELPLVDVEAIESRNFTIVVDSVNSTGGIAVPKLLEALGVNT